MSIKIILIISVISRRKKDYFWMTFQISNGQKNIVLSMSMSTTWLQKISSLLYKQKTAKHFWLTLTACDCQFRRFFPISFMLFSNFLQEIFYFLWPSFYYSFLCVFESGFCLHKARMERAKKRFFYMWRRLNKTEKPFSVQGCARAFLMTKCIIYDCLMTVWPDIWLTDWLY